MVSAPSTYRRIHFFLALVAVDGPESESEEEEYNGMFDDGEVEGGDPAENADVQDDLVIVPK